MLNRRIYIGLLPATPESPGQFAVLDADLRLLLNGQGSDVELAEIVSRYPKLTCAVAAPLTASRGHLRKQTMRTRFGLNGTTTAAIKALRVCDFQLQQMGLAVSPVISTPAIALTEALQQLALQPYHPASQAERQLLEANPQASFATLIGRQPYPSTTLEGRLQRQLLLFDLGLPVPDAMQVFEEITRHHLLRGTIKLTELHTPEELNVLITAFTAYLAGQCPQDISLLGEADEGQLVLPVAHLRPKYA